MARYECAVCGYVYDDDQEAVRWEALPATGFARLVVPTRPSSTVWRRDYCHDQEVPAPVGGCRRPQSPGTRPSSRPWSSSTPWHGTDWRRPDIMARWERWAFRGRRFPQWDDIQILPAQLATKPLAEDVEVGTELVIGPNAKKPLRLKIPIFVSDMSFGALSEEAKTALAKGAEMAGTGIASGEGGMLPEENAANSRYLFELGSAKFGYSEDVAPAVQAFHFKAGQAAKTGTGGHLPGSKVKGKIATIRRLPEGQPAISPPSFADLTTPDDFRRFADRVRELTGGIPIGMKMSAQHIEEDIDFALAGGRRLHHPRRAWRCDGCRPLDLPGQHLGADHPGPGTSPPSPRSTGPIRHHAHHHRRAANPGRLHQGPVPGSRRNRRLPMPPSRRSAALRRGSATRTTAPRASPPRRKNFGHG